MPAFGRARWTGAADGRRTGSSIQVSERIISMKRNQFMPKQTVRQAQSHTIPLPLPPTQRFLPLLLLLFVGSGCAALIYEIVWFQLIELVIGSVARADGGVSGGVWGGV